MRSFLPFLLAILGVVAASPQDSPAPMSLPADYRDWVFLSAGLGMTYGPLAATPDVNPRFENVFMSRPAYQSFLKDGRWPDKTTFILEIRSSDSRDSINVGGHYQTGIAAIEAEVKDAGKWTFYAFGKDGKEAAPLPRTERCYSCHAQNGAVDNTFVQFYPTLLPIAQAKGTLKVSAEAK